VSEGNAVGKTFLQKSFPHTPFKKILIYEKENKIGTDFLLDMKSALFSYFILT